VGLTVHEADRHLRVQRAALAVYGAMTLLAITEAATIKGVAESPGSLSIVLIAGSLSVVIAHAWASVVAHRLVAGRRFTREEVLEELWFAGSFLAATAVALITIVASLPWESFDATVSLTVASLLGMLLVVGVAGARRSGSGRARALAWGLLDVGVGMLIVLLKDLLTLIDTY